MNGAHPVRFAHSAPSPNTGGGVSEPRSETSFDLCGGQLATPTAADEGRASAWLCGGGAALGDGALTDGFGLENEPLLLLVEVSEACRALAGEPKRVTVDPD